MPGCSANGAETDARNRPIPWLFLGLGDTRFYAHGGNPDRGGHTGVSGRTTRRQKGIALLRKRHPLARGSTPECAAFNPPGA